MERGLVLEETIKGDLSPPRSLQIGGLCRLLFGENLILSRVVAASFWGDMQTGFYRGIVDNVNLTEVTLTS